VGIFMSGREKAERLGGVALGLCFFVVFGTGMVVQGVWVKLSSCSTFQGCDTVFSFGLVFWF
jgi:hypothetical protein